VLWPTVGSEASPMPPAPRTMEGGECGEEEDILLESRDRWSRIELVLLVAFAMIMQQNLPTLIRHWDDEHIYQTGAREDGYVGVLQLPRLFGS
jgi:hypothetical protein